MAQEFRVRTQCRQFGSRTSATVARLFELPVQTGCCRWDSTGECRRTPIPDLGRPLGRLSGVPRNLTFVGGRARGRFSHSATMPGQRLLPLAANWSFRPKPASRVAPKQPDGGPSLFVFRFHEAAVRDLTHPATSSRSTVPAERQDSTGSCRSPKGRTRAPEPQRSGAVQQPFVWAGDRPSAADDRDGVGVGDAA